MSLQKDVGKRSQGGKSISPVFARLLANRGISPEEVSAFLNPSLDNLSSPYDIYGLKEAADRLRRAVAHKEKILIFGDYDCDGICAIAILMLALKGRADAAYFIPNRLTDGYGMNVELLRNIVAHRRPDLVVTVDCGITSVEEVAFLKSQGIDVVVTDHHEPQEQVPDCIIADAKMDKKGFYDLCGAGVALKLVQALFGDEYKEYLDICAIATIADVVPLVKDNRIIAYYGLRKCTESPRRGIKLLAGTEKPTSQDVMFRIAPRINAAGRLGSAMKAVDLFLDEDYFLLKSLAEELERDNTRRQQICEQVVREAEKALRGIDFLKTRIIVLHNAEWEAGVLGIAAARLVEEFKCPAILFSGDGDEYKGSARSVKSVNIFEVLSRHAGMFTTFGGHSQAAGVGIKAENFEAFRKAIVEDVAANYAATDFLPVESYDLQLDGKQDFLALAKELELLEPTGYGNPKPEFLLVEDGLKFERVGFGPHVKCVKGDLELMGFSRYTSLVGTTRGSTAVGFSLGVNVFQNRVYAQGILRDVTVKRVQVGDDEARRMCLHQLSCEGICNLAPITCDCASEYARIPFGTAFVVFTQAEYERLIRDVEGTQALPVFVGTQKWLNPQTCVVFAPSEHFDFGYFTRVVIAGRALTEGYLASIENSTTECCDLYGEAPCAPRLSDDEIRSAFMAFDAVARKKERAASPAALAVLVRQKSGLNAEKYEISRRILTDLGLISVSDRGIITVCRNKTDLGLSAVYRNVRIK